MPAACAMHGQALVWCERCIAMERRYAELDVAELVADLTWIVEILQGKATPLVAADAGGVRAPRADPAPADRSGASGRDGQAAMTDAELEAIRRVVREELARMGLRPPNPNPGPGVWRLKPDGTWELVPPPGGSDGG